MKAEDIYSIAMHLCEKELKKLILLLERQTVEKTISKRKKVRKQLITEEEAKKFILERVFKIISP